MNKKVKIEAEKIQNRAPQQGVFIKIILKNYKINLKKAIVFPDMDGRPGICSTGKLKIIISLFETGEEYACLRITGIV